MEEVISFREECLLSIDVGSNRISSPSSVELRKLGEKYIRAIHSASLARLELVSGTKLSEINTGKTVYPPQSLRGTSYSYWSGTEQTERQPYTFLNKRLHVITSRKKRDVI